MDKTPVITAVAIIVIAAFAAYNVHKYSNTEHIKSSIDGNTYMVRKSPKKQKVADTLAIINMKITSLIHHLPDDNENVSLLKKRYKQGSINENITKVDTTFTINKGQEISFCITTRDKKEEVYDINTLMFVAIHEVAHIGCKSYGHGEEFVTFFKFLLNESIKKGIYDYVDYSTRPVEYCDMIINTTPL